MSEVSTYLKVGTTALVLAMVEDGALRRDLALEDPVRAIKEISHDTTCTRKVRLKRGKEFSAIELQREYLDLARAYYATVEQSAPGDRPPRALGASPRPSSPRTRASAPGSWTGSSSTSSSTPT